MIAFLLKPDIFSWWLLWDCQFCCEQSYWPLNRLSAQKIVKESYRCPVSYRRSKVEWPNAQEVLAAPCLNLPIFVGLDGVLLIDEFSPIRCLVYPRLAAVLRAWKYSSVLSRSRMWEKKRPSMLATLEIVAVHVLNVVGVIEQPFCRCSYIPLFCEEISPEKNNKSNFSVDCWAEILCIHFSPPNHCFGYSGIDFSLSVPSPAILQHQALNCTKARR